MSFSSCGGHDKFMINILNIQIHFLVLKSQFIYEYLWKFYYNDVLHEARYGRKRFRGFRFILDYLLRIKRIIICGILNFEGAQESIPKNRFRQLM
jgi:hypothetical protein